MSFEVIDNPSDPTWSMRVDADTKLVEVAAFLQGLGTGAIVEFIYGGQGAVIKPLHYGAPKPTPEQIRDILEHGIPRLPNLRIVTRSI